MMKFTFVNQELGVVEEPIIVDESGNIVAHCVSQGYGEILASAGRVHEIYNDIIEGLEISNSLLRKDKEDLLRSNEALEYALYNLLQDTQHLNHEDCDEGPCPVRAAREVLRSLISYE